MGNALDLDVPRRRVRYRNDQFTWRMARARLGWRCDAPDSPGGAWTLWPAARDHCRSGILIVVQGALSGINLGIDALLGGIPASQSVVSRSELLRQGLGLVRDYIFTGSGLGVFPMVLSTYALMMNVLFLTHAHNLFLQIWIEQGLLGFVALMWLVVGFYHWLGAKERCSAVWL